MVYRGHVQNGVVIFEGDEKPPEGAQVTIEPVIPAAEQATDLRHLLRDLIGAAPDLPADMSVNLDHYLYGVPKVKP